MRAHHKSIDQFFCPKCSPVQEWTADITAVWYWGYRTLILLTDLDRNIFSWTSWVSLLYYLGLSDHCQVRPRWRISWFIQNILDLTMLIRVHEESFVLFFFNSFILLDKKPFLIAVFTLVGALLMFMMMGNKIMKGSEGLEYKIWIILTIFH